MAWNPETRKEVWKWGRDLGLSIVIVPALLLYADMSPLVMAAGGLVSLGLLKIWEWRPRIGYALAVITILGAGGWYWHVRLHDWPFRHDVALPPPPHRSPLDQTVQLECGLTQIPETIPADGWHEISVYDRMVAYMGTALPPGSKNNLAGPAMPSEAWRCQFENFGNAPVVNVEADLIVRIRTAVRKVNYTTEGALTKTLVTQTPRVNLGTGTLSVSTFYVRNYSSTTFAEIALPKTVTGMVVQTNRRSRRNVILIEIVSTLTRNSWLLWTIMIAVKSGSCFSRTSAAATITHIETKNGG